VNKKEEAKVPSAVNVELFIALEPADGTFSPASSSRLLLLLLIKAVAGQNTLLTGTVYSK